MTRRLTLIEIGLRFRRPLETVVGRIGTRRSVLVGLTLEGVTGWGEAPAFPSGRFGSAEEAFTSLERPDSWVDGRPTVPIARAALEAAEADTAARASGRPLHDWLGASGDPTPARHPIGLIDAEQADREAAWLDSHGVTAVKVKIAPGRDVAGISRLRSALPALDIGVDANQSYRSPDDSTFDALAAAGVSFVEQPFPAGDLASHAALRARTAMAVCLDESIESSRDIGPILETGAADQISIKLNRHGLTELRRVLAEVAGRDVGVRLGGTFDTSIGRRHLLAASGLPGIVDTAAGPPSAYLCEDVATYPDLDDGLATPTDRPGIGTDPIHASVVDMETRRTTLDL